MTAHDPKTRTPRRPPTVSSLGWLTMRPCQRDAQVHRSRAVTGGVGPGVLSPSAVRGPPPTRKRLLVASTLARCRSRSAFNSSRIETRRCSSSSTRRSNSMTRQRFRIGLSRRNARTTRRRPARDTWEACARSGLPGRSIARDLGRPASSDGRTASLASHTAVLGIRAPSSHRWSRRVDADATAESTAGARPRRCVCERLSLRFTRRAVSAIVSGAVLGCAGHDCPIGGTALGPGGTQLSRVGRPQPSPDSFGRIQVRTETR